MRLPGTREAMPACPTSTYRVALPPSPPLAVTYLSFICFVLIAASLGEEEWVAGKATITQYFNRRSLAYCADPDAEAFGGRRLQ